MNLLILPLTLFLSSLSIVASNPVSPTITPAPHVARQVEWETRPVWVGYYWNATSSSSIIRSMTCWDGWKWTTSSSYAACCSTATSGFDCKARIATACLGGDKILFANGATASCPTSAPCNEWSVFPASTAQSSDYLRWMDCRPEQKVYSFFKQMPQEVRASTTSSPTTASSSQPHELSSVTSKTAQTSGSTISSTPPPATSGSQSQAWIAGVVVGAIGLIAVAGLVFWIFRIKKRNKANEASQNVPKTEQTYHQHSHPHQPLVDQYGNPTNLPPYTSPDGNMYRPMPLLKQPSETNPVMVELPTQREPSELPVLASPTTAGPPEGSSKPT
ncbi:hypothetical protein B0J11DRAFT_289750 [Dendryphion nanum]|uniref:Uncharacterized protein n=1 Tax=Dendryphion nanum TaxID=256645 RepID=A0A9P9DYR8_9PLEO|nr:hypothetical protein B0J11DRAFT_289750 [Dendryphion nanum]